MPTAMRREKDRIEVETGPSPAAAVIWLHGLGADGSDFVPLVPEVAPAFPVRFVFPHAPVRAVTINLGLLMPAWYDIRSLDLERRGEDEKGIAETTARIEALLAAEKGRGIDPSRTVLAGFSQGGAMACHAGLRHGERLAGILCLSGYLVLPERLEAEAAPANRATPLFHGHGIHDAMVPVALAERGVAALERLGYAVDLRRYPVEHGLHPAEVADVAAWLAGRLQ